jgi:hypothetical protein
VRGPRGTDRSTAIPNWFAYIALFGWPAVCIVLFSVLSLEAAVVWSLLGGYMLLPSALTVDLPLLPPVDKLSIAAISTLVLCLMKGLPRRPTRQSMIVYILGSCYVVAPIFTSLGNSYELQTAGLSIPGFYPLDGVKYAGRNLITLIPFFIGSRVLYTDKGRTMLLAALPTALVFYSLPMLFEVRMSPQLHTWVYGYFPNDAFSQQMRGNGFRPVVFFSHGLVLAFFTSLCVISALVLIRVRWRLFSVPASAVAGYLGVILLFCKSLAPIVYSASLAPIVLFTRPRLWVKLSCVLILMVCAYPLLRANGLAPTQAISRTAGKLSHDRQYSFATRVYNEGMLLEKANVKPVFGWGTWGRNRIYDRDSGRDVSITDGGWIIEFGVFGWFGYISLFGFLAAAAFQALRAVDSRLNSANIVLGGLTLLLGVQVVDQIPNANPWALNFLIAGSIATGIKARKSRSTDARMTPRLHPSPVPSA